MEKSLEQLLVDLENYKILQGDPGLTIKGIAHNSRKVGPEYLFACITGFVDDGHKYIDQAYSGGARAFIVEKDIQAPRGSAVIKVPSTRAALGRVAAAFYDYPSRGLTLLGVTGTNGKTTTTYMINAILKAAGFRTGLIGTISNEIAGEEVSSSRTTPESLELQELLFRMKEAGATHVIMEVSSHALELERVIGCVFRVAVFTNLTQDHLDFHHDLDKYFQAKIKLFATLLDETAGVAVINGDDSFGPRIIEGTRGKAITYGLAGDVDLKGKEIDIGSRGVTFTAAYQGREDELGLLLTGKFNVYNALAALGAGLALGIDRKIAIRGLEGLSGVPGRFELVDAGQDFMAIVDYAHTPDGLDNILQTARELTGGKLIAVFGCGGDRDQDKRPKMGRIAAELADITIITSDNPRSEEPIAIIRDIEAGVKEVRGANYLVVTSREEAIRRGVELACPDDVLLVVGKGHENYQEVKGERFHFDDKEAIKEAIEKQG
ncbi:MAG: UDP-N-acetylmuramoyl-L-alanyl-D-glutamate--2,6-diaminopimelate ligase [Halanaerobium sp.]|nr:UDP-N-acetylmuramoyl-L-alanyl-D-glutamate--2,6-diaminopimelate ligase [Halanaerobium sp.]